MPSGSSGRKPLTHSQRLGRCLARVSAWVVCKEYCASGKLSKAEREDLLSAGLIRVEKIEGMNRGRPCIIPLTDKLHKLPADVNVAFSEWRPRRGSELFNLLDAEGLISEEISPFGEKVERAKKKLASSWSREDFLRALSKAPPEIRAAVLETFTRIENEKIVATVSAQAEGDLRRAQERKTLNSSPIAINRSPGSVVYDHKIPFEVFETVEKEEAAS